MRVTTSILILIGALVAAPAAPAAAQPGRSPARWPVGSAGALMRGSMLYVLTPRLEEVLAIDVEANELRWRTPVQDTAQVVGHELAFLPSGTLVLHAGDQLHVFDTSTGAILASHAVPMNGVRWNERAHLWADRGVCAIRAPCAFQLVDCGDGAPIGAPFTGNSTARYRADGTPETGCWNFATHIQRRHGDHLQIVLSDFIDERGQAVTTPTSLTVDRRDRSIIHRSRARMPRGHARARPARPLASGLTMRRAPTSATLRRPDGTTLASFPTDAWIIGEHVLTRSRQAVVITEARPPSQPGTLRRFLVPLARATPARPRTARPAP